jgi:peptidoglycan/xylan/chitin deacetylase (PgdA/CDA1 family)
MLAEALQLQYPMTQLRVDRLATLFLFQPVFRMRQSAGVARVPILMYHSISRREEKGTHPYYRTVTSPDVFADHMQALHQDGYRTANLAEVASRMRAGDADGMEKTVVITFDDGYQDFYSDAFPVLSRYNYSATIFLPTAYIGDAEKRFNSQRCLTWTQVRELAKAGIEFGSHTVTHPQLWNLSREAARHEIRDSKAEIEQNLASEIQSFSYPYALPEPDRNFTQFVRETLAESGYQNGVSTIIGTASAKDDIFFMRRLPANSCDDPRLLRAKLAGAYDWLHTAQYAWKAISGAWARNKREENASARPQRTPSTT